MLQIRKPLISIITVVYNGADTIEASLNSVGHQSYENLEFIIVDGASTDGTLEIISRQQKDNIKLISEKDRGIFHAMNKGLELADGDWIIFLGADDLLAYPTVIEELANDFREPDGIYYGNAYIKTINRLYNGKISKWSMSLGSVSHQAIFYPKSVYKKKSYDESYKIFADHIYNIELYRTHSSKFYYLPKLISIYSGTGVSSHAKDEHYKKNLISVVSKNFGYVCGFYVWVRKMIYSFIKTYKK